MSLFFKQVWALFLKDLRLSLRSPQAFLSVVLFGALLLLLFNFALGTQPELMKRIAPGVFWLAILFASTLTLEHSFQPETEDGQWEGLLLLGAQPRAIFLGKLFANLFFVMVLQVVLLFSIAILFDLNLSLKLVSVLLLGSFGICTLGTFYGSLTSTLSGGQALLPLLLFPMLIPLLLASVKATEFAFTKDLFAQQVLWLKLLILFDTIFFLGSLLASKTLFEKK